MQHVPVIAASSVDGPAFSIEGIAEDGILLSVGLPRQFAQDLVPSARLVELAWTELCAETLNNQKITVVACPLIAAEGDSVQVIEALLRLGYTGKLLVAAPKLPNPGMVLGELQVMAPQITVALFTP